MKNFSVHPLMIALSITLLMLIGCGGHKANDQTQVRRCDVDFTVKIKDGITFDQLLNMHNYDWTDPDINGKNFTIDKPHHASLCIMEFTDSLITKEKADSLLATEGLVSASASELLAFDHRDLDSENPTIMALGTAFNSSGIDGFLCLDGKNLQLRPMSSENMLVSTADCAFLAKRK